MRMPPASAVVALLLTAATHAAAQQVIPQPVKMTAGSGRFTITAKTVITGPARPSVGSSLVTSNRRPASRLLSGTSGAIPQRAIVLRHDPSLERLGSEPYRLIVRPSRVEVRAS